MTTRFQQNFKKQMYLILLNLFLFKWDDYLLSNEEYDLFTGLLKIICSSVHIFFPRYHYDGIAIKKNSSFYARYCSLLFEKNYHRFVFFECFNHKMSHDSLYIVCI